MKKKSLRLTHLEITFVVYNKIKYFSRINNWKFSECESLKRFYNLSPRANILSMPKISISPRTVLNSPIPTPPILTKTPKIKENKQDIVYDKINKMMNKNSSVKHINYKIWKKKLERGNTLSPTEELFARILAKNNEEIKKYDSIQEVKNLVMKMAINMDPNKSKRRLQEAIKKEFLSG